jgi:hypothetical protein
MLAIHLDGTCHIGTVGPQRQHHPYAVLCLAFGTSSETGTWLEVPMLGEGEKLRIEHNRTAPFSGHIPQSQKCAPVLGPCSRLFAGITRCQGPKDVNRFAEIEIALNLGAS